MEFIYWVGYAGFIIYGLTVSEVEGQGSSGEGVGLLIGLCLYGFIWPIMWPYLLIKKNKR